MASQHVVCAGVELVDDAKTLASNGVIVGTSVHLARAAALAALEQRRRQQHREWAEQQRLRLMGVRFPDVQVRGVLGHGCHGSVLDAEVRGIPVAVKIMFNYGQNTTLAADVHSTEYRFLQLVPPHWNIVGVLGVIHTSPLSAEIVQHLPEFAREAATMVRRGRAQAKKCGWGTAACVVILVFASRGVPTTSPRPRDRHHQQQQRRRRQQQLQQQQQQLQRRR